MFFRVDMAGVRGLVRNQHREAKRMGVVTLRSPTPLPRYCLSNAIT
jgi:hypothetical protein